MAEQIVRHLNNSSPFLHAMLFGFRFTHSTEIATYFFTEKNKIFSLDKGEVVGAVFLDLGKAFKSVNCSVLLRHL